MNTRIFSVVLTATVVTVSSGCTGMGNFLFGRGARCGSCSSGPTAVAPPAMATPYTQPYVAAPEPCHSTPPYQYQPAPYAPQKNCFLRNWFGRNRNVSPPPCQTPGDCYSAAPCYSCYGSVGDCGCGSNGVIMDSVVDPYMVQPGQIIEGDTVIQGDDFRARRFDSDGARIIWEQPATEL